MTMNFNFMLISHQSCYWESRVSTTHGRVFRRFQLVDRRRMWTFSLLLKAITILYYAVLRNHSNDYKSILECYKTITKISFHPCTLSVNHRAISEWWDSSSKSHYKKTLNNRMIIMSNCTSTQCVRMYNVGCIKSWIFSNLLLEISLCSSYLYSQKTVISDPC